MTRWPAARALSSPAALIVAGRSIGFAASFGIPIVLVRVFDLGEFGTYKQLFLIFGTLYGLAQLGIAESLYYFIPRHPEHAQRHVANAIVTLALAGVAAATLVAAAGGPLSAWMANPSIADQAGLLGVFLALMLTSATFEIVLISRGHYASAAWSYAVSDVGRALLIVAPVLVFQDLGWLMFGAIGFAALRLSWMLWRLWREFGLRLRPDLTLWRGQLGYALPFALAVSFEVVQANYHHYIVASRVDAATFAIFAVGCLQIPLVDVIATSAANVLMVKMAEAERSGHTRDAVALWHDTMCRVALVIFPLAVLMLLTARDLIVTLFTASYAASVPIFMLWTLSIVPSVLCVDAVLRVHAQTRFLLVVNVARLAFIAALIGGFLSAFGLAGAVLVVVAAMVLSKAAGVVRIAHLLRVPLGQALPWGRLTAIGACAIVAAMPLWSARQAVPSPPWVAVLWVSVAYAAIYVLLCHAAARWADGTRSHSSPRQRVRASITEG